jgi:hypothetical protein
LVFRETDTDEGPGNGRSTSGFPDGHVTEYGTAVNAPLQFVSWAEAVLGVLLLALAFVPVGTRVRAVGVGG